ncbi:MAG: hypothetical protein JSV91_03550 [Phycisphaerales bacterium]|nr:MAG: hypothetical protein JSV91_03550 [Phycisphaerales bacterium]
MNLTSTVSRHGCRLLAAAMALNVAAGAFAQATPPPTAEPAPQTELPEARQILQDAIKAMGGKDAVDRLESSKMKLEMGPVGGSAVSNATLYWAKSDQFFIKGVQQGRVQTIGFDGKIGWASNPNTGGYDLLNAEQIAWARDQVEIQMQARILEKDFQKIETVDLSDFDGQKCYKIHLVQEVEGMPGNQSDHPLPQQHAFFNAKTGLMEGKQVSVQTPMGPMTVTLKFKDWKQIDEIMFFRRMTVEQTGRPPQEMRFTEIELNNVDPSVFEAPEAVKKLAEERQKARDPEKEDKSGDEKPDAPGTDKN